MQEDFRVMTYAIAARWLHRVATREQQVGSDALAIAFLMAYAFKARPHNWHPISTRYLQTALGLDRETVEEAVEGLLSLNFLQRQDATTDSKQAASYRLNCPSPKK